MKKMYLSAQAAPKNLGRMTTTAQSKLLEHCLNSNTFLFYSEVNDYVSYCVLLFT